MSSPTTIARAGSPTALPGKGAGRMLWTQVRCEVLRYQRVPEYFISVAVLPIMLFVMFGLPHAAEQLPDGTAVTALLFVSFSCYAVVSQALFSFGAELVAERQKGWLRRLRATPMPMWVYFTGKLALNLVFAITILAGMALVAGLAGQASFDLVRLAAAVGILLAGTVAFAPMGAAIAYWVRPRAATTIVNLVFLPLCFVSGYLFPVATLPQVLQDMAPFLPTYHFGRLAWAAMAPSQADRAAFGLPETGNLTLSAVIVIGWFVLCTALTAWGYRRELERERS